MIMQRIAQSITIKPATECGLISNLNNSFFAILRAAAAHLTELRGRYLNAKYHNSIHPFIRQFFISGAQNGTPQNH